MLTNGHRDRKGGWGGEGEKGREETDTQTNRDRETVMAETKYETRMPAELRQRMQLWQRLEEGCKEDACSLEQPTQPLFASHLLPQCPRDSLGQAR